MAHRGICGLRQVHLNSTYDGLFFFFFSYDCITRVFFFLVSSFLLCWNLFIFRVSRWNKKSFAGAIGSRGKVVAAMRHFNGFGSHLLQRSAGCGVLLLLHLQ